MEPLHYLIAKTLASKNFSFILTKLLGFKKESEIESNIRRGFSRLILLLTALIIAQALFQPVLLGLCQSSKREYDWITSTSRI